MSTETANRDLIEFVGRQLAHNKQVRRKLPEYGRVHIDRRLPFLAVYRRPPDREDPGTERLLLGEASYLLAPAEPTQSATVHGLLKRIIQIQQKAFGAFLIIELWSSLEKLGQRPRLRLFAPTHHTPAQVLEQLETALLDIHVAGQNAAVELIFSDDWAPPGLEPVLGSSEIETLGCTVLGLEVSPIYRDTDSGALFPFELRELHRALGHALKRGFHAFTHACTKQRPAHYHELGRRAETTAVWQADRRLTHIANSFDILLHVTPTNAHAAYVEFTASGYARTPEFLYRPRPVDPTLLKRSLYRILIERIEDPALAYLFEAKRDEIDRQLTLIADRGTPRFLPMCQSIYGRPEESLLTLAGEILNQLPPETDQSTANYLDADSFACEAESQLAYYRQQWPELPARVEVRDDLAEILVSHGRLLISRNYRTPVNRVAGTLAHELGTHMVTYYNGLAQPFRQLGVGMAYYEALQEGLAVLAEYLVGELDRERLRLLAGRVLAAESILNGADFVETFRELHLQHGFDNRQAFLTTMRIFRAGGYIKDIVYLRGLVALLDYLKDGGDLEWLYLGKVAMEHIPLIEELSWRRVLRPNRLRPSYLECSECAVRQLRLSKGMNVLELLEEPSPWK